MLNDKMADSAVSSTLHITKNYPKAINIRKRIEIRRSVNIYSNLNCNFSHNDDK